MLPVWKNPLVAIDIRTTGPDPERHEICQLAAIELNSELVPRHGVEKLILNIIPAYRDSANRGYIEKYCMPLEQLLMTGCSADDALRFWRHWASAFAFLPICYRWDRIQPFLAKFTGSTDFYTQPIRDVLTYASYVHDRHHFYAYNPGFTSFTNKRIYELCDVNCFNLKDAALTSLANAESIRFLLKHMLPN